MLALIPARLPTQAPVIRMTVFSATDINQATGLAGVFGEISLDTT
jgi:hypothetical protein